jgi:hypothetical protein
METINPYGVADLYNMYYQINFFLFQSLMDSMKCLDGDDKGTIASVNLILQFLFFELRYSNKVRKWFDRKLSMELDELISKTTTGKLFDKLSVSAL